jgi:Voltage gated chloride channel
MVACGISATFSAPVTGVFSGVEIILREFAADALLTVMLSSTVADVAALPGVRVDVAGEPERLPHRLPRQARMNVPRTAAHRPFTCG